MPAIVIMTNYFVLINYCHKIFPWIYMPCFIVVLLQFVVELYDLFTLIIKACFSGTGINLCDRSSTGESEIAEVGILPKKTLQRTYHVGVQLWVGGVLWTM